MIKHLKALDSKVITKSDINAICRFLNGLKFTKNEGPKQKDFSEVLMNCLWEFERKITKDQNEFGRNWLKERYINKKGQPRKQLKHDFNYLDVDSTPERAFNVIKGLKDFRFVGVTGHWNSYFKIYTDITPVYKAIGKNGDSFTYTFGHWGKLIASPEIIRSIF